MLATVLKINNGYEATGLDRLSNGKYEMLFLHSIGSKVYKTFEGCKRAIEKHGFEYIEVSKDQMVSAYD